MNRMADAMLKAGIIQKEDVEAAQRRELLERETLEEDMRQKREEIRKQMESGKLRREFRQRARPIIREHVIKVFQKKRVVRASNPIDEALVSQFVDAMTEYQLERLEREL